MRNDPQDVQKAFAFDHEQVKRMLSTCGKFANIFNFFKQLLTLHYYTRLILTAGSSKIMAAGVL